MQEYSQLQTKFNSLLSDKEKLETNLQNQLEIISQRQSQEEEELNRLLNEERQRCDALANDNESMLRLLEETRSQTKDELTKKNQDIEQLNAQVQSLQIEIDEKKQIENEVNDLRQFKEGQLTKQIQVDCREFLGKMQK